MSPRMPPLAPDPTLFLVPKETTFRVREDDRQWFEKNVKRPNETWVEFFHRLRLSIEAELAAENIPEPPPEPDPMEYKED